MKVIFQLKPEAPIAVIHPKITTHTSAVDLQEVLILAAINQKTAIQVIQEKKRSFCLLTLEIRQDNSEEDKVHKDIALIRIFLLLVTQQATWRKLYPENHLQDNSKQLEESKTTLWEVWLAWEEKEFSKVQFWTQVLSMNQREFWNLTYHHDHLITLFPRRVLKAPAVIQVHMKASNATSKVDKMIYGHYSI